MCETQTLISAGINFKRDLRGREERKKEEKEKRKREREKCQKLTGTKTVEWERLPGATMRVNRLYS